MPHISDAPAEKKYFRRRKFNSVQAREAKAERETEERRQVEAAEDRRRRTLKALRDAEQGRSQLVCDKAAAEHDCAKVTLLPLLLFLHTLLSCSEVQGLLICPVKALTCFSCSCHHSRLCDTWIVVY